MKALSLNSLFAAGVIFSASAFAQTAPTQPFSAGDFFWNAGQSALATASNWSTDQNTATAASNLGDISTKIFGRMNGKTTVTVMTSVTETVTIKGILNDVVPTATTPAGAWTWFDSSSTNPTNFTVSDGIVNTSKYGTDTAEYKYSTTTLIVRGRNGGKDFTANIGGVYGTNGSRTLLGSTGSGEFITTLNITDDIVLKANADSTLSVLEIRAKNFSMTAGKNIYLEGGNLGFYKASNKSSGELWGNPDVDFSGNTIYAKGTNVITIGNVYNSAYDSIIKVGDINISDAQTSTTTLSIYTDNATAATVGKISATTSASGITGGTLSIYTGGRALTVESMDVALETVDIRANLTITGDLKNTYLGADALKISSFRLANSGSLTITGALQNDGRMSFDKDQAAGANVTVSMAGIKGGSDDATRITTVSNATTTLLLNGNDADVTYTFKGRIHDVSQASLVTDIKALGQKGAIGIVKEGVGKQYLRGNIYYRGDTIVKSGELYMNASGLGKSSSDVTKQWGIAKLILEGGKFGAAGSSSEVGSVMATDIEFKGGILAYDIASATSYDKIKLSGETPVTIADGNVMKFEVKFLAVTEDIINAKYSLIDFGETLVGDDILNDAELSLSGIDTGVYKGVLSLLDNRLTLSLQLIPEPSTYAAIFGLAALLFVIRRRKSK